MSKKLAQTAAPLLGVLFALAGLLTLGQQARAYLREKENYRIAFRDIDCPAPVGLSRAEFLSEVQYLGAWPDDVRLLEDRLAARLEIAFAAHPWVEAVRRIEVGSDRRVRVQLAFRAPVLTVPTRRPSDAPDTAVVYRSVDARGVLLPRSPADGSLQPALASEVACPPNRAGTVWDDVRVQTAVRTAVYLRPYREQLGIEQYEFAGDNLVVQARFGRIVWGRAPGDELRDEAPAEIKLQHLLDEQARTRDGHERDIRALAGTDSRLVKSK